MKRLIILLLSVFVLSLAFSSCVSNKKCSAYGETHYYQKDNSR
jgi:ABC-type oligopeptide transport system substrate-binding subunit